MPQPFAAVVAEHGPALARVCRALAASSADGDDLWAATFLSALEAYPRLRPGSTVRSWLVTIAQHKAIDHYRRTARRAEVALDPDAVPAELPGVADADDHEELRVAVRALAPKQRAAVTFRYLGELSYAEVAELLGCSEAAARRSAADGIARLRKTYGREHD